MRFLLFPPFFYPRKCYFPPKERGPTPSPLSAAQRLTRSRSPKRLSSAGQEEAMSLEPGAQVEAEGNGTEPPVCGLGNPKETRGVKQKCKGKLKGGKYDDFWGVEKIPRETRWNLKETIWAGDLLF